MASSAKGEICKWKLVLVIAQAVAEKTNGFFEIQGEGKGDLLTNAYMNVLNDLVKNRFGKDYSQQHLCPGTKFCVDFYFPDEATIVEIALSARNPVSEYERDLFKALLAKDAGHDVRRLVFISRPGALKKLSQPGPKAIAAFVARVHSIETMVEELVNDL